jgi:hypothetical protein
MRAAEVYKKVGRTVDFSECFMFLNTLWLTSMDQSSCIDPIVTDIIRHREASRGTVFPAYSQLWLPAALRWVVIVYRSRDKGGYICSFSYLMVVIHALLMLRLRQASVNIPILNFNLFVLFWFGRVFYSLCSKIKLDLTFTFRVFQKSIEEWSRYLITQNFGGEYSPVPNTQMAFMNSA